MPRHFEPCAWAIAFLAASCTVGPDYSGPPVLHGADGTSFRRAAMAPTAPGPMTAEWWRALGDPMLDRLEADALSANPDLQRAAARLRQSRAALREQHADLLPSTNTTALYLHTHGSIAGLNALGSAGDLDLYNAGFDASWEIDLFGGQRRAVQQAAYTAQAVRADLAAAQVTLTAEVAQNYVRLRDLQHRAHLARDSAALQARTLDLTQLRLAGGAASVLDVARLTTQVEQTSADIIPLDQEIAEQLDRLAILTGQVPGRLDAGLAQPAHLPLPPATVQVGDPQTLLRHRPDIQAAERRIAASTAAIGERVADYFPKLSLFGSLGYASTDLGTLFSGAGLTAIAAPMLQWRPFDFGRTHARIGQAEAARDEALADYRATVLNALNDAEDALARYGLQQQRVAGLRHVNASAAQAAALTRQRYDGGTATLIDTLDTERQRLDAEQSLAQAQADLTLDFIGLQKSLGLGWKS